MRPPQATSLAWISLAASLFLLASTPNVEATSFELKSQVSVQNLEYPNYISVGCTNFVQDIATSGGTNASTACGGTGENQSSAAGSARASFGSIGAAFSTTTNISADFVGSSGSGGPSGPDPVTFLAEGFAQATSIDGLDIFDVNGNPIPSGILAFAINLEGTLTHSEIGGPQPSRGSFAFVSLNVTRLNKIDNTPYFQQITSGSLSPDLDLTFFIPFENNGVENVVIDLVAKSSCARVDAVNAPTDYTCMTSASFFTSATVTGLDVLDNSMNPITNAVVSSDSGFDYQAGFQQPPGNDPIPEPSTVILFGTGLAGLLGWQYRKRKFS